MSDHKKSPQLCLTSDLKLCQMNGDSQTSSNAKAECTDKLNSMKLPEIINPSQLRSLRLPDCQLPSKIVSLTYTSSGSSVLALTDNAVHKVWKWQRNASSSVPPVLWQPASGTIMTNILTGVNQEDSVPCFAVSKNDSYLVSTSGGEVSLFNLNTFEIVETIMKPSPSVTSLIFHPENNNVFVLGMDDGSIEIYDILSNEVRSKLKGHQKRVTGLAISNVLNVLVSLGDDAQICIWSMHGWDNLAREFLEISDEQISCAVAHSQVQFHSNEMHVLVVHPSQLAIYEAPELVSPKQWFPPESTGPIVDAVYSCYGDLIFMALRDGSVSILNGLTLQVKCWISPGAYLSTGISTNIYPTVVAAHPSEPSQFALGLSDGGVLVIEPSETPDESAYFNKTLERLKPSAASDGSGGTRTLSNVKAIFIDKLKKSMKLPKIIKPSQLCSLQLPDSQSPSKVVSLMYTNSGSAIIALADDALHKVWKWQESGNLSGKASSRGKPILWLPRCRNFMTNTLNGVNQEDPVSWFALSKNDSYLLSTSGGEVSLFNLLTFKRLAAFVNPAPAITTLTLHHKDNNIFIQGMDDGSIKIYYSRVDKFGSRLMGHQKRVTSLAISKVLNVLISSGNDAQICVWSMDGWDKLVGEVLQTPVKQVSHTVAYTRIEFHSDGRHLLAVHPNHLAIYKAPRLVPPKLWFPWESIGQITDAVYSCYSHSIFTTFQDGSIRILTGLTLQVKCRISPDAYIPADISTNVYPTVVAAHPSKQGQFALGLSNGGIHVIEPRNNVDWGIPSSLNLARFIQLSCINHQGDSWTCNI